MFNLFIAQNIENIRIIYIIEIKFKTDYFEKGHICEKKSNSVYDRKNQAFGKNYWFFKFFTGWILMWAFKKKQ